MFQKSTDLGTCRLSKAGRMKNCQGAVPQSKVPAMARDHQALNSAVPTSQLAQLVDTRDWSTGGGNTFPGAEAPFGMVQWSPDTLPDRNAGGGYGFGDTTLDGYSLTHVSGPGCGAAGDVPILPFTGAPPTGNPNNMTTSFTNTGEIAQAGYYSAQSNMPSTITSEFTATPHSSMGRFTFPATTQAGFDIKLQGSQNGTSGDTAQVIGNNEVSGSVTSGDFCGESNNDGQSQLYTVYFDITFSQPFTASKTVFRGTSTTNPQAVELTFDTTAQPVIMAKVGISYVSAANAKLDWQTENPNWDFDSVKTTDQAAWDKLLGKIDVSGGTASQTQEFYSLLYKDLLQPNITSDVNGQYMGSDGKVATLAAGQQNQYGMFSGWDIYHSLSQLQTILDPTVAGDEAQSLLNYYSQDKILQQWGYNQLNNYVMVGDPSQSIIADINAFGGTNFDRQQALKDMLAQATTVNDVRPGEALEQQLGYLPEDGSYGCCNPHGYMSTLLEYDTEDVALAHFAADIGDQTDSAMLTRRANNWENLFDPNNNLLTSRLANGQFEPGVTPTFNGTFPSDGEPYVEGDPYEYTWDVPNNYPALFSLLGGKSKVIPELKTYLSQPEGFGMFAQLENEFDFGEQFALNYAGDPAGTQQAVNNIRNTIYGTGPSGLDNNDDLGANSSSFIWEMLGMYPENSGTDTLVLTSPGFPHAAIHLDNGKTITVNAPGASANKFYVKSMTLDGQEYTKLWVPYSQLDHGATFNWTLGTKATGWGNAPSDAPPSYTAGAKPFVGFLPSQQVTVAPGSSVAVQVGAQNATDKNQTANVVATPVDGLALLGDTKPTLHLKPNGRATTTITVQAPAGTPQTFYSVPITVGGQSLTLTVLVAQPGSLQTAFNNNGISSNADPSAANFDGGGFSYSAEALAADGVAPGKQLTVGGVTFTWPDDKPGFPDNAIAQGQDVTVNAPAGTESLGFLGSATNGPSQGVATLHYADGSTAKFWLGLSDWTLGAGSEQPSFGNVVEATTSFRNCPGCTGGQTVDTNIFETSLPVDPTKTLKSVTLPQGADQGQLHIFDIGTSDQAPAGPVAASLSPATAAAGQQVTINGSGFGATQGSVVLTDDGTTWGAPGGANALQIDSWSDTSVTFTVPSPSGSTHVDPGSNASVEVMTSGGATSDQADLLITPTANLPDYFDNIGISSDDNQACSNMDGVGFSYSETALANAGLTAGGTFTSGGLTFTWPGAPVCSLDNVLADGQEILVNGKAGDTQIGLVGGSTDGDSSGTLTINYTDGTSTEVPVAFSDWASPPSAPETQVAMMPYRNSTSGTSQLITMYVGAVNVPVDSSKTVASIILPTVSNTVAGGTTAMHIFAISLG